MAFTRHQSSRNGLSAIPRMGFLLFLLALAIVVWPNLRPTPDAVPAIENAIEESPKSTDSNNSNNANHASGLISTAESVDRDGNLALDGQTRDLLSLVVDNSLRMAKREMPAYWELVRKTSNVSFERLREQASHEMKFNDFYSAPAKHRGELVALDVIVRRVNHYEAESGNSAEVNGVYEIWGSTDESQSWLYVFITDSLPNGFNEQTLLKKRVQFAGYFLKLLAYQPGSARPEAKPLLAPLLIGRFNVGQHSAPISTNSFPGWATWGLSSFIILTALFFTLRVFSNAGHAKKTRKTSRKNDRDFDSMWEESERV